MVSIAVINKPTARNATINGGLPVILSPWLPPPPLPLLVGDAAALVLVLAPVEVLVVVPWLPRLRSNTLSPLFMWRAITASTHGRCLVTAISTHLTYMALDIITDRACLLRTLKASVPTN